MLNRLKTTILVVVGAVCLLEGCSSERVGLGPRPRQDYRAGDTVQGSACGLLLFGIFPINVNTRTERAYEAAVGGNLEGLTDTQIRYSWYGIPLAGLLLCTDVEGRLVQ